MAMSSYWKSRRYPKNGISILSILLYCDQHTSAGNYQAELEGNLVKYEARRYSKGYM